MQSPRSLTRAKVAALVVALAALGLGALAVRGGRGARAPEPPAALAAAPAPGASAGETVAAPVEAALQGPGPAPVDAFHPRRDEPVRPAWGGTVVVHLPVLPKSLNYMLETSSHTRWIQYELHEALVERDWESWELTSRLARSWETADTLWLRGQDGAGEELHGDAREDGDAWVVLPLDGGAPRRVPRGDVERVERATVVTFRLRDDARWHDGVPFSARDVVFTRECYANPGVRCDTTRERFAKIRRVEALDAHTVRFTFEEQYFGTLSAFTDFFVLPAHLYDLRDPRHPRHDPRATPEQQAAEVNDNPHNTAWVGLGPYRLTYWGAEGVVAERFEGYFDPEHGGYLDTIRWRYLAADALAIPALENGDLDFTLRVSSSDYFGPTTQSPAFTARFYKGYYYAGGFNYVPWNMRKPWFSDLRVRKALTSAMDMEEYKRTVANGLADLPTGPMFLHGPAYDRTVERLPYDPARAEELLAEAGWYDRDGDGILDKDGIAFDFEYLVPSANSAGRDFSQKLQESLARLGIRMRITSLEWAAFLERLLARDFDAAGLAFTVGVPEDDPGQLWSSAGAPVGVRGSNHCGVADPHVDELIARGQRELDDEKRWAIWRELHRYLYESVHPYLYNLAPPRKFAMSQRFRGVQCFAINPGYSIRRWFLPAGTPGTRPARER